MLGILADSLLLAVLVPPSDRNARLREQLRREDEEWMGQRRAGRYDARMR